MFKCDDRVKIVNFPDSNPLNGAEGTILGMSYDGGIEQPGWQSFIVLLDNPLPSWKALSITSACLEKI